MYVYLKDAISIPRFKTATSNAFFYLFLEKSVTVTHFMKLTLH